MSVPNHWKVSALKDVVTIEMGQSPPSQSYNDNGSGLPFFQGKAEFTDWYPVIKKYTSAPLKIVEKDAVLLSVRAPVGPTNLAPERCCIGRGLAGISSTEIPGKFLLYFFRSIERELSQQGTGTTFAAINKSLIEQIQIPLPPLPEQKRIVAKLDTLFAHLDQLRSRLDKIPVLLKQFRQAVLTQAVTGKLTEEWRGKQRLPTASDLTRDLVGKIEVNLPVYAEYNSANRFRTNKEFDPSRLARLPDGWIWCTACEVVDNEADIVYGIVQPGPKLNEGVPYVRGMDIEDGEILVHQLLKTSAEIAKKYERAALKGGDVLLGIIRSTKVAIVPEELQGANITQGTARLRPSSLIQTDYMAYWLASSLAQKWLHDHYRGIDMPGLNLRDVRKLPIPMCSLKEQSEICRRVKALFGVADVIDAVYRSLTEKIGQLPETILTSAFCGELEGVN